MEIDLLQRPPVKRIYSSSWRKQENREIAQRFDREFFDGDRVNGYGGYYYDGRWVAVAERIKHHYNLSNKSSFLDIGCAKGFLLHDIRTLLPEIKIAGLDISAYAIENSIADVRSFLSQGSADSLPYEDHSFDFIFSVDTLHNLPPELCEKAFRELNRVCRPSGNIFVQVDAYKTPEEQKNMEAWSLTAKTHMYVYQWLNFFEKVDYRGDYFWTIMR